MKRVTWLFGVGGVLVAVVAASAIWSWKFVSLGGGVGCLGLGSVEGLKQWHRQRQETAVGRMRVRLNAMLQQIRRRVGRGALRQPWYIVMGPEAVGKSRLLDASGLLVHAIATPSAAPETHARVLATELGIMVDAPGRLIHPAHAREWRAWLGALCFRLGRHRLAGVVVALDVHHLREPNRALAHLQAALAALLRETRVRAPVHLVITHTDELVGFAPTFDAADKLTASAWGFSLDDTEEVALAAGQRMTELITCLRRYSVAQLSLTADSSERARRYMFPQSLGALEQPLARWIEGLFGTRTSEATLRPAGVYWTAVFDTPAPSAQSPQLQAGAKLTGTSDHKRSFPLPSWAEALVPRAPHKDKLSEELTGPLTMTRTKGGAPCRAYFVTGFFSRVLPHHAAGDTRLWRSGVAGLWGAARGTCLLGCGLIALLAVLLFGFAQHSALVGRIHRAVMPLTMAADDGALERALDELGELSVELLAIHARGMPWHLRFGQGSIEQALRPVGRLTLALGQALVLGPDAAATQTCFTSSWQSFGFLREAPDDVLRAELLSRLRSYLLLTVPKEQGEPTLADPQQVAWLQNVWQERLAAISGEPEAASPLTIHLSRQLALMAALPELLETRQPDVVLKTRSLLQRRALPDLLVDGIVHDSRRLGTALDAERLQPGSHSVLISRRSVPQGLGRAGFVEVAQPLLSGLTQGGSAWLLGPRSLSMAVRQAEAHDTRARYFARYVAAWESFFDGLRWHEINNMWGAQRLLESLTEGEPKLLPGLLRSVCAQVALADATHHPAARGFGRRLFARLGQISESSQVAASNGGIQSREQTLETAEDVQLAFASLAAFVTVPEGQSAAPIDQFQDALVALKSALAAYLEAPRGAEPLLEQLRQTRLLAHSLLEQVPSGSGMRPRLASLMVVPLDALTRALAQGVRSQSDAAWGPQVVQIFRPLARRYPFHPQGLDAPVAEVLNFFRPTTGELWSYYRSELAQDIVPVARGFAYDGRMGGVVRHTYHPGVLRYLTHARAVTQAFFPGGDGSEPGSEVEVRLVGAPGVHQVSLLYDGHALSLSRGERTSAWQRWHWPPRGLGTEGTSLTAAGDAGAEASWRHEGVWALWRLLESGQSRIDRELNGMVISWPLGGHSSAIQLEVRPLRRDHPFFQASGGLFGALRAAEVHPPLHLGATKS